MTSQQTENDGNLVVTNEANTGGASDVNNDGVSDVHSDVVSESESENNDVSRTMLPPPQPYERACADGTIQQLSTNATQSAGEKPPSYAEAVVNTGVLPLPASRNRCASASELSPNCSLINDIATGDSIAQYARQCMQHESSPWTHQYPPSLTNYYPPSSSTRQSNAPTLRQFQGSHFMTVTQYPVEQPNMDRSGIDSDLQSKVHVYFLVSILTCLCCNALFGIIAICFSLGAKQAAERGDSAAASSLGNRAIVCCAIGTFVTILFLTLKFH